MKIQKILILTISILFCFLIIGSASATSDANSKNTIKKPATTTTTGQSNIVDPYENPYIDGNNVVYQKTAYDSDGALVSSEIYLKPIGSSTESRVSSYYGSQQVNPAIYGSKVVWQDLREGFWAIYWKDVSTGNGGRISTNHVASQKFPDISGNKVVWQDFRESYWAIYWKDINSGSGGRVSTYTGTNLDQENPAISGSKVVWEDHREGKWAIYWKDINSGSGGRVSSYYGPELQQRRPDICGDIVVWTDYRESGHNIEDKSVIYWKDLSGGEGGRLSSYYASDISQHDPAISGTKVVWVDRREGPSVIYWKDMVSRNGGRISSYTGPNLYQFNPSISGNKVVWQDLRNGYITGGSVQIENWAIYWKDVISGNGGLVAKVESVNLNHPPSPVKLIFIHHSCGSNWLADGNGNLGSSLNSNNYYVSESDYGWDAQPNDNQGDHTDTSDWPSWFNNVIMPYVYNSNYHSAYTNTITNPGGENEIIMFKSCFPLSEVVDSIDDEKVIYNSLLPYFAAHPNKLFVLITPPGEETVSSYQLTRNLCNWLTDTNNGWLKDYTAKNVFAFDFYGVLSEINSHHRWTGDHIEHVYAADYNGVSPYHDGDDHPNSIGNQKATAEFLPLLNIAYNRWKEF